MSKGKQNIFRKYPLCGLKGNLFFFFYNLIASLYLFFIPKKEKPILQQGVKILLCCEAALGDVLLASSVIPSLKEKFPRSTIGFLCKKESSSALSTEKKLSKIHLSHKGNRKQLLEEIKKEAYDLSIELHPFSKNSIILARKAGIPMRIGFDSAGYDVWLTDPVSFPKKMDYLPNLYPLLLEKMGISISKPRPNFVLNSLSIDLPKKYIVLHLGTSNPLKEWSIENWKELSLYLREKGCSLIFTGKGAREKKLIEQVSEKSENFCDRLSWSDFAGVIQRAELLISVDSVSLHLAALFNTPIAGLYLYSHGVELWLPEAKNALYLISKDCVCKNKERNSKAEYLEEIKTSHLIKSLNCINFNLLN